MRVGEGLAFKFSPVGGAMLTLTGRDKPRPRQKGLTIEAMTLFSNATDFIVCTTTGGARVDVAKPYLLRRTPFDGQSRNGIAYTYGGLDERTAARQNIIEDQLIVPRYVIGDQIVVLRGLDTGARVAPIITSLDLNVDGRQWARKAPEP
jgi:hypothetical protein